MSKTNIWAGRNRCSGCDTTQFGTRYKDEESIFCSACFSLKYENPFCDICNINQGWGVIEGIIYCEGCYHEQEQEFNLDRMASHTVCKDIDCT